MPPRFPSPTRLIRFLTAWLLLAALAATPAAAQDLVIRFFDVGQGDAALITSPEGKSALIDGGNYSGWPVYLLDSLHIDTLDLVVASHNHADHIRGLQSVVETTTVRYYVDNGVPASSAVYSDLISTIHTKGISYRTGMARKIQLGSVTLRILPLPPSDSRQNNSSVGILLTYGKFTALFTGDAEDSERAFWEANAKLPRVTVLKVAHHGSANGTDQAWIAAIRPRVAVISVGATNSYGHPAAETLQILEQAGVRVYRTDLDGDITVSVKRTGAYSIFTEVGGLDSTGTGTAVSK